MTRTSETDARVRPDVTGMRIAHRGMIADTRRFADLTRAVADGAPCPPARAAAVAEYLTLLCDSIHHHHTVEDEVVWPVLTAAAGSAVTVDELADDHVQLDAVLATLRERTSAFGTGADRRAAAAALSETLAAAHALLAEHIADEERVVFPIVDRYVSVADWTRVEKAAKKGGKLSFEVPRVVRHADAAELARLRAEAGPVIRILLKLMVRSFEKREAVIAG